MFSGLIYHIFTRRLFVPSFDSGLLPFVPLLLRVEMTEYHLAQQYWRAEGALVIRDDSGQQLLVVPIEFLRQGRVQNYGYVQQQLGAAWAEPGHLSCPDGTPAPLDGTAVAGNLTFRRAGTCRLAG